MQVIWKLIYSTKSGTEKGTLYQLKNLINRKNIGDDVTKDMNAHEDFFNAIVTSHILAAAMEFLGMECLDSEPHHDIVPSTVWMEDLEERKSILSTLCTLLVHEFVEIHISQASSLSTEDSIRGYASKALALGLLYTEFVDATREGDGSRIIRCWKYLLVLFRENGRTNYALEAFVMLAQHRFLLSPRQALQLAQSRFINVHGLPRRNISCDIHMEHLNRILKTSITTLGANKTPAAIQRLGKCIGPLAEMLDNYDTDSGILMSDSSSRRRASFDKELTVLLDELYKRTEVFKYVPGRKHDTFPNLKCSLLTKESADDKKLLSTWMKNKWKHLLIGLV